MLRITGPPHQIGQPEVTLPSNGAVDADTHTQKDKKCPASAILELPGAATDVTERPDQNPSKVLNLPSSQRREILNGNLFLLSRTLGQRYANVSVQAAFNGCRKGIFEMNVSLLHFQPVTQKAAHS